MRFATIQTESGPRAALFRDGAFFDLHATDPSLPSTVRSSSRRDPVPGKAAEQAADWSNAVKHEAGRVKLLPPIPDPPKIVCIGLNYRDHAAESGAPIPEGPDPVQQVSPPP